MDLIVLIYLIAKFIDECDWIDFSILRRSHVFTELVPGHSVQSAFDD